MEHDILEEPVFCFTA